MDRWESCDTCGTVEMADKCRQQMLSTAQLCLGENSWSRLPSLGAVGIDISVLEVGGDIFKFLHYCWMQQLCVVIVS